MMDGETVFDDMAVAASFAALVYTPPPVVATIMKDPPATTGTGNTTITNGGDDEPARKADDNEIDLGSEQDDSSSDSSSDSSDDENDDEKDAPKIVDLEKERSELERMQQGKKGRRKNGNHNDHDDDEGGTSAPKTENELDSYRTPLSELEQQFQLDLTVQEKDYTSKTPSQEIKLCLAGNVKAHMVQDRTVIVECFAPPKDTGTFTTQPLDEGSLLVFRMELPAVDDDVDKDNDNQDNTATTQTTKEKLIPLGKVFEVFGPVRRPLYTVRLPCKQEKKKKAQPLGKVVVDQLKDAKNESTANQSASANDESENQPDTAKDPAKQPDTTNDLAKVAVVGGEMDGGDDDEAKGKAVDDSTASDTKSNGKEEQQTHNLDSDSKHPTNHGEEEEDHWLADGKYTLFLAQNPELAIYYVQDAAKMIDAQAILRMSARGCGKFVVYIFLDPSIITARYLFDSLTIHLVASSPSKRCIECV